MCDAVARHDFVLRRALRAETACPDEDPGVARNRIGDGVSGDAVAVGKRITRETERLDLETDAGFLDRVAADPVVVRMRAERAEARQVHPEVPVGEPVVRDEEVAGLFYPDADAARAAGEGVAGEGVAR